MQWLCDDGSGQLVQDFHNERVLIGSRTDSGDDVERRSRVEGAVPERRNQNLRRVLRTSEWMNCGHVHIATLIILQAHVRGQQ